MNIKEKNKEFLRKYDTDEKQINFYTEKAMEMYKYFEIDFVNLMTYEGVRKNVETWYENKSDLFDLFRKHDNWDEEAKAIIFHNDYIREADPNIVFKKIDELTEYLIGKCAEQQYLINNTQKYLFIQKHIPLMQFIQKDINETYVGHEYEKLFNEKLIPGQKLSKLLNKSFKQVSVTHFDDIFTDKTEEIDVTNFSDKTDEDRKAPSFNKYFAQISDALNPIRIPRISVLSLNFLDYATMSNGNSWASCHYINSHNLFHEGASSYNGCYKAGTLSYANDFISIIFYTIDSDFDGDDYYLEPKIHRQMFHYDIDKSILLQSRLYPQNNDDENIISQYRNFVQEIISICGGFDNSWYISKDRSKFRTESYGLHYEDYEHYKVTWSYLKEKEYNSNMCLDIGHEAYDLSDGYVIDNEARLIDTNDISDYVCEDCGSIAEFNDDLNTVITEHGEERWCQYCIDNNAFYSGYSYRYYSKHDFDAILVYTSFGEELRESSEALDDSDLFYCDKCGEYLEINHFGRTEVSGDYICDDCLRDGLENGTIIYDEENDEYTYA